ncbi:MAG TPA: hypothetical protein VG167_18370 [Verrucomicrobiae bacterium]|nr:hypothetical protein [Verrucomicrobiae bacterium]
MIGKPDNKLGKNRRRHRGPAATATFTKAPAKTNLSVSTSALPRIILTGDLLPRIGAFIHREIAHHGYHKETGGMLVGEFVRWGREAAFLLSGFIEAGPKAERTSESVLFDHEYQAAMLQGMRLRQPTVGNMGCLHMHPGQMDECSVGDQVADREAVRASDTRALVFVIVTANNRTRDSLSLRYDNLKFDFFLMSDDTRLEYVHVRPRIMPGSRARLQPRLANLLRARDNRAVQFGCHHTKLSGLLGDKRRLVAEVRAMEERYGDRAVLRFQRNLLFWEYTVMESSRRFPIEIRYPRRYPLEPPRIISRLPLPPSPHQLVGHELCWIDRSAMGDWNPARDTASTCVCAAHRWFACLLVYLTLGAWPEEANDAPPHVL